MPTQAINISGQTFGKWAVISRAEAKPRGERSSPARWLCRCECGLEKIQDGSTLRSGKSKGCASCTRRIRPFEAIFNLLVSGAVHRGIDCTLTYPEYLAFTKVKDCHYCGAGLAWVSHSIGKNGQQYNLDRKDSSKGYHAWNCVPCCTSCNQTKSNLLSYEEMVVVGEMRRQKRSFVAPTS